MSLKIRYQNPRRPTEAGLKLVADQSQGPAEKAILEGLGFTVIEIAPKRLASPHDQPAGQTSFRSRSLI